MNEIETKFWDNLISIIDAGYIVQHIKPYYRTVGHTLGQSIDDAVCECDAYAKIQYETFIKNEFQKRGQIDLEITKQININGYKLDFYMQSFVPNVYMGIEIDGHEWHERSKEQASSDKKRERKLLSLGIPCIRFTGSDVFTNADGCAKESLDIFFNYYFELVLSTPENWDAYLRAEGKND